MEVTNTNSNTTTTTATTTRATVIGDLPDGLLVEILIRLPLKYPHKCKSVSKRWLYLISDPYFARKLARHKITKNTVIGTPSPPPLFVPDMSKISLKFLPRKETGRINVLGSSYDLLLCCESSDKRFRTSTGDYYVCNPFTKHWVKLPPAPTFPKICPFDLQLEVTCIVVGFICDPYYKLVKESRDAAVDAATAVRVIDTSYKYRVVRTPYVLTSDYNSPSVLQFQIFSSETGKWTELNVARPPLYTLVPSDYSAFVFNRKLHWLSSIGILVFDPFIPFCPSSASFVYLPAELKQVSDIYSLHIYLSVCKGRLRISGILPLQAQREYGLPPVVPILRVWELKDYNESKWSCTDIHLDMLDTSKMPWFRSQCLQSVQFSPYDEDTVFFWFFSHFVCCNLRHKVFDVMPPNRYDPHSMNFLAVQQLFPTPVLELEGRSLERSLSNQ